MCYITECLPQGLIFLPSLTINQLNYTQSPFSKSHSLILKTVYSPGDHNKIHHIKQMVSLEEHLSLLFSKNITHHRPVTNSCGAFPALCTGHMLEFCGKKRNTTFQMNAVYSLAALWGGEWMSQSSDLPHFFQTGKWKGCFEFAGRSCTKDLLKQPALLIAVTLKGSQERFVSLHPWGFSKRK